MNGLEEARQVIDRVDREMAALFAERMKAAEKVAAYKKEKGLPVEDREREVAMLKREIELVPEAYRPYYAGFLNGLVRESKNYQRALIHPENLFGNGYEITVERGALARAGELFRLNRRVLILTDDGVPAAYAEKVASFCKEPHILSLPAGESNKCPDRWLEILRFMSERKFDRSDCVVCVGGGVMGDLGGFAAASYMRGIDLYMVPTTLLSQIDSSVGGKVAVDFGGYKNLVGAFCQPKGVLIDPETLTTLDRRQWGCGMAEAIKMFALADPEMFELLEKEGKNIPIEKIIRRAVQIKLSVVLKDEKEGNLRRCLNFGHTVGHAVESVSAAETVPLLHGECVGLGMLCMTGGETRSRIARLLKEFDLPLTYTGEKDRLREALLHDKKTDGETIVTVTVPKIGSFAFEKETADGILARAEEVLNLI